MVSEDEVRHFNVMLEDILGRVKFIAEGHVSLADKVDGLAEKVDRMDVRLGRVEDRLSGVEVCLGGVEVRLGGVDDDVKLIKTHLHLNGAPPRRRKPASKK